MNFRRTLVLMLIAVMITLGLSSVFIHNRTQAQQPTNSYTQIYNAVSPSVVAISVTQSQDGRVVGGGTGSGFVIDTQGHIVTNNHVVDEADFIEVEFYNGLLAQAEIVGLDPDSDIAVLRVNVPAETLAPVTFGDSDALAVGDSVLAIGSPFGQDWTLTTGIVSGLDRVIRGLGQFSIGGVIQTDAAINPGNSGGPLLNAFGQVIGVNSQILSESGSNSGVGFAVPGNLVRRVAQELMVDGSVDYSYMGISGIDVNLRVIQELNLPANTRGVILNEVIGGSPANLAGLRAVSDNSNYDIITGIDNIPVKTIDELISYLARNTVPNQTITVTVLRNGNENLIIPVTLASRP